MASIERRASAAFDWDQLAESERASVLRALCGLSSAAVAEELGVHPATVRSYLSRAYRKLGVSSIDEVRARLSAEEGPVEDASSAASTSAASHVEASLLTLRARRVAALTLLLLLFANPFMLHMSGGWYATCGLAVGCLCVVARRRTGVVMTPVPAWCIMALALLSAISNAFLIAVARWRLLADSPVVLPVFVLTASATSLAVLLELLAEPVHPCGRGLLPFDARLGYPAAAGVVLASAAFAPVWMVCATLIALLLLLDALHRVRLVSERLAGAASTPAKDDGPATVASPAVTVGAGAVLGFFWQETWRPLDAPPYALLEVPALLLLAVGAVVYTGRHTAQPRAHKVLGLLSIGFLCGVIWLGRDASLGPLCMVFVALGAAWLRFEGERESPFSALHLLLGIALGLCAGCVLDALGGFAARLYAAIGAPLPRPAATSVRAYLLGSVTVAVSAAFCYQLVSFHGAEARSLDRAQTERARLYLAGRGLNDIQVDVALLIASGYAGSQIAGRLSYSIGSVNVARRTAYQKLGIHSRRELLDVLKRDAGVTVEPDNTF